MEAAVEARAETEEAFIGGRWLSGRSNDRRKWARAEEVSIGPRAEAISGTVIFDGRNEEVSIGRGQRRWGGESGGGWRRRACAGGDGGLGRRRHVI